MSTERPPMRQRGVTLVELILFIVIVGIALGGILTVMNLSGRASVDPVRRKQALIIAEGLLEEVELANFSYCDPSDPDASDEETIASAASCTVPERWGQQAPEPTGAANGRPYDNVNDYVSAPGVASAAFDIPGAVLADAGGAALGVSGYTARLSIVPAVLGGVGNDLANPPNPANTADTDVLRITVTVSFDGESISLDGYRLRYAPHQL